MNEERTESKLSPYTRMQLPYLPPFNTPVYWMDEQFGMLPQAVRSFTAQSVGKGTCTEGDLRLVIEYVQYVIDAPCWSSPGMAALRRRAKRLCSAADVNLLIGACLKEGFDPL